MNAAQRLAASKADTMPAPVFELAKECKCGCRYDEDGWRALEWVGVMPDGMGGSRVLRNCICGSTISRGSDEEREP